MTSRRPPGINHPESLELWEDWERSRHRARRAKHALTGLVGTSRLRRRADADDVTATGWSLRSRDGERPERVLIALDAATPTLRASLLSFLPYLRAGADVLAPAGLDVPEVADWSERTGTDPLELARTAGAGVVVTIGQHLTLGRAAHALARDRDLPELVVQHGALTPFAPPLPHRATLLAWSDEDAEFWRSGRRDVLTRTIGSQLLWEAAHEGGAPVDPQARPVFLGQLHGAELPRRLSARTAMRFCREHDAVYRPHPAETDLASRTIHRLMRRRGIQIAAPDVPLRDLAAPVVAVFSTGVLEAAARGLPATVWCPDAPPWVHELWRRYRMHPFGGSPTPSPACPDGEPAAHAARLIEDAL